MTKVAKPISESKKVEDFKVTWLRAAGYNRHNANRIARSDIDWHLAHDIRIQCDDEDLCMQVLFGSDDD